MERDKIWVGQMTEEQDRAGGIWTIGNQPYDPNSDYPGRSGGSLMVKSWVAHPDKYKNYEPKDRKEDGLWEYVQVFGGCLECRIAVEEGIMRYPLHQADGGIEIAPATKRSWYLPSWCPEARGITVLRHLPIYPPIGGWGMGYEFAVWDTETRWGALEAPTNLPDWSMMYVEVFSGSIELNWSTIVKEGSHAFWKPGMVSRIHPVRRSCGVVIYIA